MRLSLFLKFSLILMLLVVTLIELSESTRRQKIFKSRSNGKKEKKKKDELVPKSKDLAEPTKEFYYNSCRVKLPMNIFLGMIVDNPIPKEWKIVHSFASAIIHAVNTALLCKSGYEITCYCLSFFAVITALVHDIKFSDPTDLIASVLGLFICTIIIFIINITYKSSAIVISCMKEDDVEGNAVYEFLYVFATFILGRSFWKHIASQNSAIQKFQSWTEALPFYVFSGYEITFILACLNPKIRMIGLLQLSYSAFVIYFLNLHGENLWNQYTLFVVATFSVPYVNLYFLILYFDYMRSFEYDVNDKDRYDKVYDLLDSSLKKYRPGSRSKNMIEKVFFIVCELVRRFVQLL